jgi:uncharacterized Tic20 family protein
MAAVSHFFGVMVAIIIYAIYQDKSKYVRFQSLQAAGFSLAVAIAAMLIGILSFIGMVALVIVSIIGITVTSAAEAPEYLFYFMIIPFFLPWVMFGLLVPYVLLTWLARLIAAIRVLQGKDFRYPWLGKRLEKLLYTK